MQRFFLCLLCLGVLLNLAACAPPVLAAPAETSTPPNPPSVSSTAAPTTAASAAASPPVLAPTASPTAWLPSPSAAPSPSPAPSPTALPSSTPAVPTGEAPASVRVWIPPTLMLHPRSDGFDSVLFLQEFVAILQREQMQTITYRTISENPAWAAAQQGKSVIITIDDVMLQSPPEPRLLEMVAILRQANYTAVLGVISAGLAADEDTVRLLKELAAGGWEIAAHTDGHSNLAELELISPGEARKEIRICNDKIEQATGLRPITLILPYGQMVQEARLVYKEQIAWAVGISGGESYRTRDYVHYVGREGPASNAEQTFQIMLERFRPEP